MVCNMVKRPEKSCNNLNKIEIPLIYLNRVANGYTSHRKKLKNIFLGKNLDFSQKIKF